MAADLNQSGRHRNALRAAYLRQARSPPALQRLPADVMGRFGLPWQNSTPSGMGLWSDFLLDAQMTRLLVPDAQFAEGDLQ